MWPQLPLEFNVPGTPVSLQSRNSRSIAEWKAKVLASARAETGSGSWAFHETRLAVTMLYFPQAPMAGDIDNIVKLTIDALIPDIYLNDSLIDRITIQRFDPAGAFTFASPSDTLLVAMELSEPVLYIRITEVPTQDISL